MSEGSRDFVVNKSIDCCGKRCPVPIYMAAEALKVMSTGEVLEVKCTDASSVNDFPGFTEKAGHDLLAIEKEGAKTHVFYVRKGGS